jgi:hypothetical protein
LIRERQPLASRARQSDVARHQPAQGESLFVNVNSASEHARFQIAGDERLAGAASDVEYAPIAIGQNLCS